MSAGYGQAEGSSEEAYAPLSTKTSAGFSSKHSIATLGEDKATRWREGVERWLRVARRMGWDAYDMFEEDDPIQTRPLSMPPPGQWYVDRSRHVTFSEGEGGHNLDNATLTAPGTSLSVKNSRAKLDNATLPPSRHVSFSEERQGSASHIRLPRH